MLCCWLQQLQEFGGPEIDKPDLLKGSVGSVHSVHSLNKPIISDPRARYNVSANKIILVNYYIRENDIFLLSKLYFVSC